MTFNGINYYSIKDDRGRSYIYVDDFIGLIFLQLFLVQKRRIYLDASFCVEKERRVKLNAKKKNCQKINRLQKVQKEITEKEYFESKQFYEHLVSMFRIYDQM